MITTYNTCKVHGNPKPCVFCVRQAVDLYTEVDNAAQDTARKYGAAEIGTPLPYNMTSDSVRWINSNVEEFRTMVDWWRMYFIKVNSTAPTGKHLTKRIIR